MKHYAIHKLNIILAALVSIFYSCGSHRDTATSRGMQNLTARYNYIYNARQILSVHQAELAQNYPDNYNSILPVYIGPEGDAADAGFTAGLKPMNDIIKKAEFIIFERTASNYIDDAYLLLGKASFYNSNYFNSTEYFDYVARTYSKNKDLVLEALNWKARSLMQLRRLSEAGKVLDTLMQIIPGSKKSEKLAETYATLAQMCIYLKDDSCATEYLAQALQNGAGSLNKIRWIFILGQLYERQKRYADAASAYRKIQRSNAPYEMYFQAGLGQIRLQQSSDALETDIRTALSRMLRDDKNVDYHDQVYYQIGENYADEQMWEEALAQYTLALRTPTASQSQKGLAYMRMADIYFKQQKDYVRAKAYYDSTVYALPDSYPDYELVRKKAQNLGYLTTRYEQIALEDALQAIARRPENERAALIEALVKPAATTAAADNAVAPASVGAPASVTTNTVQSGFYFNNTTAISIGFNDFKKKWGNRKREDNWRQSVRNSAQQNTQNALSNTNLLPDSPDKHAGVQNTTDTAALIKTYSARLPVTPELMAGSDKRIIDAYYEIGNFYLQELRDQAEAAEVFETLLKRYPANDYLPAVFYSLFLAHRDSDPDKANLYRNKLLNDHAGSSYAKTLLDPAYAARQTELEAASARRYNEVFEQYEQKNYPEVISMARQMEVQPANLFSSQFAYLKAIAIGRTNHVDSLLKAFNNIVRSYPDDKLITPLVQEHVNYINNHLQAFRARKVALVDFDPNEPPFQEARIAQHPAPANPPAAKVQTPQNAVQTTKPVQPVPAPVAPAQPAAVPVVAVKTDGTFTDKPSATYYFVVHVQDASLTLSSSRFGIGQFNRGNYAEASLRHQLKEFDNDQLVYVGNFSTFEEAKVYASGIVPQLRQIMKVPANLYSSFIVSKENFDLITTRRLLDQYVEFYKKNY
ncbi:tetratricopeptide repeat protein [Pedobacter faecalis]|uniref:type IX secretion system periplasmic lipoprotein PorW/SprE n=1 Tax=Pedobacter faecalis TaxID=3041495 RepID=UPI00254C31D7|nr:tetratricopeptide repeat protein [Pedobacter sp. ELA7]